jgi:homoserine kinase
MKHQSITVHAPATVSNLCCGFDILGMALEEPFDKIRIEHSEQPGILIRHTDAYNLPLDPQLNIAGVALDAMGNRFWL